MITMRFAEPKWERKVFRSGELILNLQNPTHSDLFDGLRFAWRDGTLRESDRKDTYGYRMERGFNAIAPLRNGAFICIRSCDFFGRIFDVDLIRPHFGGEDYEERLFIGEGSMRASFSARDIPSAIRGAVRIVLAFYASLDAEEKAIRDFKQARADHWASKQHRKRLFPEYHPKRRVRPDIYDAFFDANRPFTRLIKCYYD